MHTRWLGIGVALGMLPMVVFANDPYSIAFQGADLRDVVRMLAYVEGRNVVVPEQIQKTVTVHFPSIPITEAMTAILEANDLGSMVKDGTLRIATAEQLAKLGGDLRLTTFSLKHAKAADTVPQIKGLLSERGSVVPDARTNAVTVRDTAVHMRSVASLIEKIDILEKQVLLDAKMIQINKDKLRGLGLQWGFTKPTGDVAINGLGAVGTADSGRKLNLDTPVKPDPQAGAGLTFFGIQNVTIDVQLTAAEKRGDLRIISRPSVVTMNNQQATIKSVFRFFIRTAGNIGVGGTGTGGTDLLSTATLHEIEAGVTLAVTPRVSEDEFIKMDIQVTQSEPDFSRAVEGIPSVIDNTAQTMVYLRDQETTIIGGLLTHKATRANEGIPYLSSMPILGALFGSLRVEDDQRELVIFLRPTVLKTPILDLPPWAVAKAKPKSK